MQPNRTRIALALAVTLAMPATARQDGDRVFDPLLDEGAICAPAAGAPPPLLHKLLLAAAETAPFQPVPPKPALSERPVSYTNLGPLSLKAGTKHAQAPAWFNQGIRLSFAFNHAEAQRAFREAQKLDPKCALCYWGEALILGPNINVPMVPEANAPALEA